MTTVQEAVPVSRPARYTGRFLSGFAILFLLLDGVMKVIMIAPVLEACTQLEIPVRVVPGLGILLVLATLIYTIPQTSVIGAILLTSYLGGATWTHVRMGGPIFPIVFPSLVAAMVWGGLYLREPRLRALVPVRLPRREAIAPSHG